MLTVLCPNIHDITAQNPVENTNIKCPIGIVTYVRPLNFLLSINMYFTASIPALHPASNCGLWSHQSGNPDRASWSPGFCHLLNHESYRKALQSGLQLQSIYINNLIAFPIIKIAASRNSKNRIYKCNRFSLPQLINQLLYVPAAPPSWER